MQQTGFFLNESLRGHPFVLNDKVSLKMNHK